MIKKKQLSDKIETLVNPLKLSVKTVTSAVKSAPDTFISTLDGFTKMFSLKASEPEQIVEAMKVGASIDIEVWLPLLIMTK
jgi:sorting nexin-13